MQPRRRDVNPLSERAFFPRHRFLSTSSVLLQDLSPASGHGRGTDEGQREPRFRDARPAGEGVTGLRSILAALALTLGWLLWPSGDVAAQGTEFNLSCNDNEVLVGIRGRQGWWMDGIAARCRQVNANGELASTVRTTAYRGGSGGTQRTFDCNRHEVMVGYSGALGDNGYVLQVHEVICAPWEASTRTAGTPTRALSAFERKGSGRWMAESCFDGKVGSRLRGRAGIYLDRLGDIGCRYFPGATPPTRPAVQRPAPPPPPPVTSAPVPIGPSGTWNVALCPEPANPPFSWQPVSGAVAYIVEFRNETRNRTTTRRVTGTSTHAPAPFLEGHQYRWRVRGTNSQGDGPWSPYLGFTGVQGASAEGPCVIGRLISPF